MLQKDGYKDLTVETNNNISSQGSFSEVMQKQALNSLRHNLKPPPARKTSNKNASSRNKRHSFSETVGSRVALTNAKLNEALQIS